MGVIPYDLFRINIFDFIFIGPLNSDIDGKGTAFDKSCGVVAEDMFTGSKLDNTKLKIFDRDYL